jgi:hypothetical protein
MRTRSGRLAVAISAVALLGCSDRVDPVTALAPAGLGSPPVSLSSTASIPHCGFEDQAACAPSEDGARCDVGLALNRNGTPLNPSDDSCINGNRHSVGPTFRGTWVDWALTNQRTLAIDEPINWVMHLSTHNAFNNSADGYVLDPNQVWSMSDQLDVGSRFLWLDIHWRRDVVRLCHGPLCGLNDRPFAYGIQEIAAWLAKNPGEIVRLALEASLEGNFAPAAAPLDTFFTTRLYRKGDRAGSSWPSRRELLAMGKQVIVGARGGDADLGADDLGGTIHRNYNDGRQDIRLIKNFEVTRTNGIVTSCGGRMVDDPGSSVGLQPMGINDHQFWVVGEDRTILGIVVPASGYVEPSDVADMVACNVPTVSLDLLSAARCATVPGCIEWEGLIGRIPQEERQPYAVWSWRAGDRGDAGDAPLLRGSDGRWTSAAPSGVHRFACGRPRSETGRSVASWADKLGAEWRVTTREGPWKEGGRACLDEYGDEGFVFSTPVNGRMNGSLRLADATRGDVWVNYNDIKQEGDWVINQRPLANAGADRLVECNGHHGTTVQLDGTQSTDPDGDQLTFEWQGPFGTATGAQPTVLLPLGTHVIRMIADDGFGGVRVDEVVIQVVDTTPPEIRSAIPTPAELWAPNHKMVPVTIAVDVHDICDATPTCRIVSVSSSEPANGSGDGNTAVDWEVTGALTLNLRAERSGTGSGRVYTIIVECVDDSGNASTAEVRVTVSHDQGRP